MSNADGTARERRWAVILADGTLGGWLGRNSDPTEEEIQRVADQLRQRGLTGWLAVTEGVYFDPAHAMTGLPVRLLAGAGDWDPAWLGFLRQRREKLDALG